MSEIIVDYVGIRKKVDEVNEIINSLYKRYQELDESRSLIASGWKGTSSQEALKKIDYLVDRVNEDMYRYSKLRDMLKTTADFWENMEKTLAEKAASKKKG